MQPGDFGVFRTIEGLALWMVGDLDDAMTALDSAAARNPDYY
jgi:hypothetical protein